MLGFPPRRAALRACCRAAALPLLLLVATACVRTAPGGAVRSPAPVVQTGDAIEPAAPSPLEATVAYLRERGLLMPVAGITPSRVHDTFDAARDGGRRQHNAIDILAPRNTPVLSADDGVVLRLTTNRLGGIVVYAVDPEHRAVYYYAHLERYHPGLAEGMRLTRGDTIGYVGTSGNAHRTVPHLHFQVMRMPEDRRAYWNGEPINPYPLLTAPPPSSQVEGP